MTDTKAPTMTEAVRTLADRIEARKAFYIDDVRLVDLPVMRENERQMIVAALRSPLPGTREEVARIIDPEACNRYDVELASGRKAQNGRMWAVVAYGRQRDIALSKADAILALPPAPMPEREGMREALRACREYVDVMLRPVSVGSFVGTISDYHPGRTLLAKIDAALTSHDDKP